MTLGDARVTADGIVLIRNPDNQYDVEGRGGVIEELRHDGFHSCRKAGLQGLMAMQINQSSGGFFHTYERQNDGEQGSDGKPGGHIVLQHLQQVDCEEK